MKVDVICSSRELFGADRAALRLCQALRSLGHDPVLIVPESRPERGLADAAASLGIEMEEAAVAIASSRGVEKPVALVRRQRVRRPDLTIINSSSVIRSSRPERRRVLIVREWMEPDSVAHRLLVQWHRRRSSAVLAISAGVRAQWERCTTGPRHRYTVWDWLDSATLEQSCSPARHGARSGIVCIGRFNQWKGQELLADSYTREFANAGDRPKLTFVGYQPGTEFAARAEAMQERGDDGLWTVLPFVDDPVPILMRSALVVVPSLRPEPFGLVILEALACGCRVIASRGGGPDDLAGKFPEAMTLTDRDPAQLGSALRTWWENGGGAQDAAAGLATRETLGDSFSPDAGAGRWRAVLSDLGYLS